MKKIFFILMSLVIAIATNAQKYSQELVTKANSGDAMAMYKLGHCYLSGYGVDYNYPKSHEYFTKAIKGLKLLIDADDAKAMFCLACCYHYNGEIQKARTFYRMSQRGLTLSAINGDVEAMRYLAMSMKRLSGGEDNISDVIYWYEKAVKNGDVESRYRLAEIYDLIHFDDNKKIYDLLTGASSAGYSDSDLFLSRFYAEGKCVKKDTCQALKMIIQQCDKGNIVAIRTLSDFYVDGSFGYPKDSVIAASWKLKELEIIRSWAESGNVEGMNKLAEEYTSGDITEKDMTQAYYWYKQAADRGNVDAMLQLALLSSGTFEMCRDEYKYYYWLEKAAETGDSSAMELLRDLYYDKEEYSKAFYWCKVSAETGNADAMYKLGSYYNEGIGTVKNYNLSFYWYKRSAEKGYSLAFKKLASCFEEGIGVAKNFHNAKLMQKAYKSFEALNEDYKYFLSELQN